MNIIKELSAKEVSNLLKTNTPPLLIDVRNQNERDFTNIGGLFIPLNELETRLVEIPKDRELVIYCHHGVRSMYACEFLSENGFTQVYNLVGGIDAWSLQVDPAIARY